jgi:hypothetical protein
MRRITAAPRRDTPGSAAANEAARRERAASKKEASPHELGELVHPSLRVARGAVDDGREAVDHHLVCMNKPTARTQDWVGH